MFFDFFFDFFFVLFFGGEGGDLTSEGYLDPHLMFNCWKIFDHNQDYFYL